jgi:hypothetical protein
MPCAIWTTARGTAPVFQCRRWSGVPSDPGRVEAIRGKVPGGFAGRISGLKGKIEFGRYKFMVCRFVE